MLRAKANAYGQAWEPRHGETGVKAVTDQRMRGDMEQTKPSAHTGRRCANAVLVWWWIHCVWTRENNCTHYHKQHERNQRQPLPAEDQGPSSF